MTIELVGNDQLLFASVSSFHRNLDRNKLSQPSPYEKPWADGLNLHKRALA